MSQSLTHEKELEKFFDRYNTRRPHQGLSDKTHDEMHYLPYQRSGMRHENGSSESFKNCQKLSEKT